MPVVIANLKAESFAEIQRKVGSGLYSSVSEFVELAIANQIELEKHRDDAPWAPIPSRPATERQRVPKTTVPQRRMLARQSPPASIITGPYAADVLTRLRKAVATEAPTNLSLKPPPKANDEATVWGQVNRLLPLSWHLGGLRRIR
ncbi:MAG: hypothetical protein IPK00_27070 [Deltaproteobacteria bacterium]|nr:hypothetical protein [Deltaproteobacteria bacterium]